MGHHPGHTAPKGHQAEGLPPEDQALWGQTDSVQLVYLELPPTALSTLAMLNFPLPQFQLS